MFAHLLDFLFPPRSDESIVADLSVEKLFSLMAPSLIERTSPPSVTLLPFGDKRIRALIHEAKYHGNEKAFGFLSAVLTEYLRDADELYGFTKPMLVPVPLGAKRLRERGFNQAEEIAKLTSKELDIPLENLLTRTRETTSQVSLAREARRENMRGAFSAAHLADNRYTYIVLDDVTTTGATLQAAIDALVSSGATSILPVALAH